jgi:hypothetical protein
MGKTSPKATRGVDRSKAAHHSPAATGHNSGQAPFFSLLTFFTASMTRSVLEHHSQVPRSLPCVAWMGGKG